MMASFVRALLRYVEPFYPVDAVEQARLQRYFLGEAPDKADSTTVGDDDGSTIQTAEATKKKVDVMQTKLNKTISTVSEMERHVERCRRDVDGLFVTWSENITDEYTLKFDKKATEINGKIEKFDQILEKKCEKAGHTAAAYMEKVVETNNAKVQQVNEQLREQLTRLENKLDEKANSTETAALAAENRVLKKRLEKFQEEHKNQYERRGQDLAEVMLDQQNMSSWVRQVQKDHEAIVIASKADAKDRRILDRHLRAMERQAPTIYHATGQATISVTREQSAPTRDPGECSCRHHEARMADLANVLRGYESRLRRVEDATTHTPPCQHCDKALDKVKRDLKDAVEALEAEKLGSQRKLEDHKTFAQAQYKALEEKFASLSGLVNELPDISSHWQIIARLEDLEKEKRWNDRVRRLETCRAATPEPVLRHLEYLESRLNTVLYDRQLPLPNVVARERIALAWEALENTLRAEPKQIVPAQMEELPAMFHQQETEQPQEPQDPEQVQLETYSSQLSQEEASTKPAVQVEVISQPTGADEVVQGTTAPETSREETLQMEIYQPDASPESNGLQNGAQVQTTSVVEHGEMAQASTDTQPPAVPSFGLNLVSNFQVPPVDVPAMDWSASVSVDLSRDASEFDDDDTPQAHGPRERLPTILEDVKMEADGPLITGSSDAGTSNVSMATGLPAYSKPETSTQALVSDRSEPQTQEPLLDEHNPTSLEAPQHAEKQSPFLDTVVPTNNSGNGASSIPGLEQQSHHISQPLYGGDASSGYTTVYGPQPVTQTIVSPPNLGLHTTAISAQQLSIPPPTLNSVTYHPTKPPTTNPSSQLRLQSGPPLTPQQEAPRTLASNSVANFAPALPTPTTVYNVLIQPFVRTELPTIVPTPLTMEPPPHTNSSAQEANHELSEPQHSTAPHTGKGAHARPVLQKPKGRLSKMTDQQKIAIRHEMEQQKPAAGSMQELPPIIPRPPRPAEPIVAPTQVTGSSVAQKTGTGPSQAPSGSTTVHMREDAVDYGSTDEDTPGPSDPPASNAPTTTAPAKIMRRYSTQWLKIWRSHVASEQNIKGFAESNGFGDSADKWTAIVENANADTKPQALLSEAKIAVHRQLYSFDDIGKIAEAFFELCLVQSGSFQSLDNHDPFKMSDYHKNFVDAFQQYRRDHPADSY